MPHTATIPFGPAHRAELDALLGRDARVIGSCIYVRPQYTDYACEGGRYVRQFELTAHSYVVMFPDYTTYRAHDTAHWDSFPDPETGRQA